MTDLRNRFSAMLDGEPDAPDDLDRVVAGGRRALRRRNTLTAVAGTAGTAAVTAAVVVPIATANHHETPRKISVLSEQPTPKCTMYYTLAPKGVGKQRAEALLRQKMARSLPGTGTITTDQVGHGKTHAYVVTACPNGATPPPDVTKPTPTTPPQPSYHYDADPQTIATGFASELGKQVKKLGFTIVYSRPFAQETSTLERGHPSYYDGNVDVQLPDGPADVGVQVTHKTTELVPFDNSCGTPDCTETKLPDGSVMQVSHVKSGGGGELLVVEIHHPDGLIVEAQEADYAFGPEATRARTSKQPLTVDQLTSLAQDPAFTF